MIIKKPGAALLQPTQPEQRSILAPLLGLPIGLPAIGSYLEDHTLLRFAAPVGEAPGGTVRPEGIKG